MNRQFRWKAKTAYKACKGNNFCRQFQLMDERFYGVGYTVLAGDEA